jgi:hypothetical protein|eukprot:COSAG01_NODE_6388_length_3698_cov_77.775493_5_plen_122_part_00
MEGLAVAGVRRAAATLLDETVLPLPDVRLPLHPTATGVPPDNSGDGDSSAPPNGEPRSTHTHTCMHLLVVSLSSLLCAACNCSTIYLISLGCFQLAPQCKRAFQRCMGRGGVRVILVRSFG